MSDPLLLGAALAIVVAGASVGAVVAWGAHQREHALARMAWAFVGALVGASFAFIVPAACLGVSDGDRDDDHAERATGRFR